MKEIKAFIHHNRIADVFHALKSNNFCEGRCNISVSNVTGTLAGLGDKEQKYSVELGESVITEVKLEVICEDEHVVKAVALIREIARTGQNLAGWIYIHNIDDALQIEE